MRRHASDTATARLAAHTVGRQRALQHAGYRWWPRQKGAWVMAIVPFLAGSIGGGFAWQHCLIGALWLAGCAFFFAGSQWLAARRAARLRLPALGWGGITAILGLINLWFCGALIAWVIPFVPLIALAAEASGRRRARTLIARSAEVVAAGLMCLVAWDAGMRLQGAFDAELTALGRAPAADITLASLSQWGILPPLLLSSAAQPAIAVTVGLTYYFWSTIPFVKSLVREHDSRTYQRLAAGAQLIGLLAALIAWAVQLFRWPLPLIWLILLLRWAYFTHLAHASRTAWGGPRRLLMTVGISETVLSLLYLAAVLS